MLNIQRKIIEYKCPRTSRTRRHYILIANESGQYILLSYPNLFLCEKTVYSLKTSNRYSSILSQFYRFLSTENKFKKISVSQYHAIASNSDIQRWQVQRQEYRVSAKKVSPMSETIYKDASLLLPYFDWLDENDVSTNVKVEKKTWIARFKGNDFLNYTRTKEKQIISSENIKILDREKRQSELKSLINNNEIQLLMKSFVDPVYSAMFILSLGTAMRPMDLVNFPFLGNGQNAHIMSYSDMKKEGKTCSYMVFESKGNKSRKIVINLADLKGLEDHYIKPFYYERAKKYEKKYGVKCPPSILFLNSRGEPVSTAMVSSRTNDAKKIAIRKDGSFRKKITFYEARHWWPTMFLIETFKDKILTSAADVIVAATAQTLQNQMGHDSIETTYKFYIDLARVLVMAHNGYVNDIVSEPGESVEEFIARIDGLPKGKASTLASA